MANKTNSLSHTKWMCKYHIVFTPKYRRKIIYNQYRESLKEIIRTLCKYKGVEILEGHMIRSTDKQHMVYFCRDGERIGAASYCTYQSEDGKCFILDYWVFPQFRGNGTGHRCFEALEQYTKADGAQYYELNSTKENSIRFWKSMGFVENGKDEYDMLLLVKR